ncbi:sporulation kinase E [bacterium BMS3Abin05]|nr:sporulation kinase E [bacterium BMS3Abin05]
MTRQNICVKYCPKIFIPFLAFILFWQIFNGSGAGQTLNIQTYSVEQGLSQSQVLTIVQDHEGYLWFGTLDGLSRFDGQSFVSFNIKDGLAGNFITANHLDKDGNIWFGHERGRISIYDAKTHSFHKFQPKEDLPSKQIQFIFRDRSGDLWFGTRGDGLYRYNNKTLRHITKKDGLSSNNITSVCQTKDGMIYLGTSEGITKFFPTKNLTKKSFSFITTQTGLNSNFITSILADRRGNIWMGTRGKGAIMMSFLYQNKNPYQTKKKRTFKYFTLGSDPSQNWIQTLYEDREGNVWLGTFGGGSAKYIPPSSKNKTGRFFTINTQNGLSRNQVTAIFQDKEGNYWFGTSGGGVSKYRDTGFEFFTTKDGLVGNSVWAIHEDGRGNFWFGTSRGLTEWIFPKSDVNKPVIKNFTTANGLPANYIISMFEDRKGYLWISTYSGGVSRIDPQTGKIRTFTDKNGLTNNFIMSINSDNKGHLWFGSHGAGVSKLDLKTLSFKNFTSKEGLANNIVRSILKDQKGNLWFATDSGLTYYNGKGFKYFGKESGLNFLALTSLTEDKNNHLWIGTMGGGVFKYDGKTFKNYTSDNGLSGNIVYSLLCDDRNNIWIGTGRGVDRFDQSDSTITHYGKLEGFWGIENNQGAAYKDREGRLWFGTISGVNCYAPNSEMANKIAPQTYITGLNIFFKKASLLPNAKLGYNKNRLTFDFIGISFANPSLVRYRYFLDGFDKGWSPVTAKREITYSNLPPGKYTFKVKACNNDRVWNIKPASYSFEILSPFWRTWWFILISISILSTVIFSSYKIHIKNIESEKKLLETNVQERTKELFKEKEKVKKTYLALLNSEEKLKFLMANVNAYLWSANVDENKNVTHTLYTEGVYKITGYRAEEFKGSDGIQWINLVHPADIKSFQNTVNKLLGGQTISNSYRIRKKDGQLRWVNDNATPIKNTDGRVVQINGICTDITEIKQAELALQESEEKFRTLAETATSAIFISKKIIQYVNPAAVEISGYSEQELLKMQFLDIVHPDFKEIIKSKRIFRPEENSEPFRYEVKILAKDGTERWIDLTAKAILFKGKTAALGTAFDITERKWAEKALMDEKEQLAVTLRSIGDGVITTSTDGRIILMNKVAEKLTGQKQEQAKGKLFSETFSIIRKKTGEPCEDPVQKIIATSGTVDLANTLILTAKDGTQRTIVISGAPLRDEDSRIIGVVIVLRDVTERQRLEEELLNAQKLESLSLLAGGIAHDFNNILTGVLGNISLAKMEIEQDNEVFDILTDAEKASLRAKDLTQQLLTFSKGGAPIKKATSIEEIIKDTAHFALRGSNVSIQFLFDNDLWPANIDEGQISQVINNLIINAQHAMAGGGEIYVCAKNTILAGNNGISLLPGRYIKLIIKDEGIGISPEHLRKIFDPYFTTKQKGSGLGLASAYSIIKRHNGHIAAESELGKGTTFTIHLPASELEIPKQKEKSMNLRTGKGKILVMDDETVIQNVVSRMLRHLGYDSKTVGDGKQMLKTYQEMKQAGVSFNAVIMDLTIPGGMGGKEAIQELLNFDPDARAIVSSGYSNDPVMADYKKFGFSALVTKPFNIKELSSVLQDVLNNSC